MKPVLDRIEEVDAIILGSPVYLGAASSLMRAFMERLVFPYLVYDADFSTRFKKRIPIGLIYTMSSTVGRMKETGIELIFKIDETVMQRIFGPTETLLVNDTSLFDDYSRYVATRFDPEAKAKTRREQFPLDCRRAFEMGARFAKAGVQ